jgi:hypothetical protein
LARDLILDEPDSRTAFSNKSRLASSSISASASRGLDRLTFRDRDQDLVEAGLELADHALEKRPAADNEPGLFGFHPPPATAGQDDGRHRPPPAP